MESEKLGQILLTTPFGFLDLRQTFITNMFPSLTNKPFRGIQPFDKNEGRKPVLQLFLGEQPAVTEETACMPTRIWQKTPAEALKLVKTRKGNGSDKLYTETVISFFAFSCCFPFF
jgi:hypothetical protein